MNLLEKVLEYFKKKKSGKDLGRKIETSAEKKTPSIAQIDKKVQNNNGKQNKGFQKRSLAVNSPEKPEKKFKTRENTVKPETDLPVNSGPNSAKKPKPQNKYSNNNRDAGGNKSTNPQNKHHNRNNKPSNGQKPNLQNSPNKNINTHLNKEANSSGNKKIQGLNKITGGNAAAGNDPIKTDL